MMRNHPTLVLALCFSGSLLAGWTLTHRSAAAQPAASTSTSSHAATRIERSRNDERAMVSAAMAPVRASTDRWSAMKAVVELAHRIPPDQISRWLTKKLFQHSDEILETLFYQTLRDRYCEIDPEDCIRGILKSGEDVYQMQSYLTRWAERDPEAVLRLAQEMPNKNQMLISAAITVFAKSDPERAYQQLAEIKGSNRGGGYYSLDTAFLALAGNSPGQFLSRCDSWDRSIRASARQVVAGNWISKDFEGCMAWLKDAPNRAEFFQSVILNSSKFGGQWIKRLDALPPDLFALVEKRSSPDTLTRGAEAEWLATDLEGRGFSAKSAQSLRAAAIVNLAGSKPEEAIAAYANLGEMPDQQRQQMEMNLVSNLAQKNPELAKQWMEGLGSSSNRSELERIIAQNLPQESESPKPPRTAVEAIRDVADGTEKSSYVNASTWGREQFEEVSREINHMSAEQITTLSEKWSGLYQMPYSLNGDLISRQLELSPETNQKKIVEKAATTASRWAREDPAKASAWVESLPAGESRRWAIINLSAQWRHDDPEAAEKWISRLSSDEDRKAAREEVKRSW